jgi:hypothetical protein
MKKNLPLILKSAGFALAVQVIATILAFVSLDFSDSNKTVALIILAVILVCLIPVYFSIKGKQKRPWLYLMVTSASYIIMAIISYVILMISIGKLDTNTFYNMNEELYVLLVEAVVGIQLVAIVLFDIVFMLCLGIANYVKNHKPIVIAFFAGALVSLLTVSVIFTVSSIKNFDSHIVSIMPPSVYYIKDGNSDEAALRVNFDANFSMPLTINEGAYFGIPDKSEYIRIGVPDVADIYIYPHNDESVIVEYNPRGFGFTQRYKAHKNFAYYMQEIYKQTGDEGFNIYPEG